MKTIEYLLVNEWNNHLPVPTLQAGEDRQQVLPDSGTPDIPAAMASMSGTDGETNAPASR